MAATPARINGASTTPSRTPRSGTPITTHLGLPGKNHKIVERTGYTDTRFAGKEEQLRSVIKSLRSKGFIPDALVENEVCQLLAILIVRPVGSIAI
jgi:hypothetical protein